MSIDFIDLFEQFDYTLKHKYSLGAKMMIKCNLAVLLAERGLNVSEFSEQTGLSRNTLSALQNNTGKGIQFETLDLICQSLEVNPGSLLSYADVNLKVEDWHDSIVDDPIGWGSFSIFYNQNVFPEILYVITKKDEKSFLIVVPSKIKKIYEPIPILFQQEMVNSLINQLTPMLDKHKESPEDKIKLQVKYMNEDYVGTLVEQTF